MMVVDLSRKVYKDQKAGTAKIREVYSNAAVKARIAEMGKEISADYKGVERPVVIGVMKGAIFFLSDLLREIETDDPLQVEFVRLASYGAATESSGVVQTPYLDLPNIVHRHILVVEDIIDSGRTAKFFLDYLKGQFAPASLKMAVLLDKPSRRVVPMEADYVGFKIDDLFVVGYGLDYAEQFRELPFLGEMVEF
ncbi:MAG: hypoxanthine phosphoribosyltransferase [Candidatus Obscuribacterales bacterium]|jgi:hypoxanthine phosphoribosyltransferase|nr:hypoxanthine phosphoribosyltransferase [Candidatus Obscuribacterales bacterium]